MTKGISRVGAELLERVERDQAMRQAVIDSGDATLWDDDVDRDNTTYLQELVSTSGWPRVSEVGVGAAHAAWLLVQHADRVLEFQLHCLELMKRLPEGEVLLSDVAYLEDRVLVAQGLPQRFGTQFFQENGGPLQTRPIEDEAGLAERRQSMGLEDFETNRRRVLQMYKLA